MRFVSLLVFLFLFGLNNVALGNPVRIQQAKEQKNDSTKTDLLKKDSVSLSTKPPKVYKTFLDSLVDNPADSTTRITNFRYPIKPNLAPQTFFKRNHSFFLPAIGIMRSEILTGDKDRIRISETLADSVGIGRNIEIPWEEYREVSYRQAIKYNFERFRDSAYTKLIRQDIFSIARDLITKWKVGIYIPVFEHIIFETIFGPPTFDVSLRSTLSLALNARITTTNNPIQVNNNQGTTVSPEFVQNFDISGMAKLGSKLTVTADYSTQRTFSFENQVKMKYEGLDDDVVKLIEVGQVSLALPSLMSGSSGLFGIKTELQFAPVTLSFLATQQQARSNKKTIQGSSEEKTLTIKPYNYEFNKHFFISNYAVTQWDINTKAATNPQDIRAAFVIDRLEVWVYSKETTNLAQTRAAIALMNYSDEPYNKTKLLGNNPFAFPTGQLTEPGINPQQTDAVLSGYRQLTDTQIGTSVKGIYRAENFILLKEGVDYTVNRASGYISFTKRQITTQDVIAVSYSIKINENQKITVGDFSDTPMGTNKRLILKLIKNGVITPDANPEQWILMLKNIYSLNAVNIPANGVTVDVTYTQPVTNLTDVSSITYLPTTKRPPLLNLLGLDRFDSRNGKQPDQVFDFINGVTIDPIAGKLIFPYLRPFYDPILPNVEKPSDTVYAYREIYESTVDIARLASAKDKYSINIKVKGAMTNPVQLSSFLVPNSVRVTYDGVLLREPDDYQVDYSFGFVSIATKYIAGGGKIVIDYEENDLVQQAKTLWGARAVYDVMPGLKIGGTFLQYELKTTGYKTQLGDEAILNSMYGFDIQYKQKLPFLNQLLDLTTYMNTSTESFLDINAQFAQILPGLSSSQIGPDDPNGASYIDDFDNSARVSSIGMAASMWFFSTGPSLLPISTNQEDVDFSGRRSLLNYYVLPSDNIRNPVVGDIFPNRKQLDPIQAATKLSVLFLDFYPTRRGPYNFAPEFFSNYRTNSPEKSWSSIIRSFATGFEDLEKQQYEYIQIWVKFDPIQTDGTAISPSPFTGKGTMYLDLGSDINEDIIPNGLLNTEDGLPLKDEDNYAANDDPYGKVLNLITRVDRILNTDPNTGRTEDVGIDGINDADEQVKFAPYLAAIRGLISADEYNQIAADPSGDNVGTTTNRAVLPNIVNGFERSSNTSLKSGELIFYSNQNPDTEDLNFSNAVDKVNNFYRYQVDLDEQTFKNAQTSKTGYIAGSSATLDGTWVQLRIPLRNFTSKIGTITDFRNIKNLRVSLTGFKASMRMSIASFDFIGSDWVRLPTNDTLTTINRISVEDNRELYVSPPNIKLSRLTTTTGRSTLQNEQAIVIGGKKIKPKEIRTIQRVYTKPLNLNTAKKIKAYMHASPGMITFNGDLNDTVNNTQFFIRFGSDNSNNYFEYRTTIKASDRVLNLNDVSDPLNISDNARMILWPTENNIEIDVQAMSALKLNKRIIDANGIVQNIVSELGRGKKFIMRGNPSATNITVIVMGIYNPTTNTMASSEVWVNELRVSDYNQESGYAVDINANFQLTDILNIKGNFKYTSSDFHGLEVRTNPVGSQNETMNWGVATNIKLNKLIPGGDNLFDFPVMYNHSETYITPKYNPYQQDVLLSVTASKLKADTLAKGASAAVAEQYYQQIITNAKSITVVDNVSTSLAKTSRSNLWYLLYTLDAIKLNFGWGQSAFSSPLVLQNASWNWNIGGAYQIGFSDKFFQPFAFLEKIPMLNVYKDMKIYYLPQNMQWTLSYTRNWSILVNRNTIASVLPTSTLNTNRIFNMTFNLTDNITFSYSSTIDATLNPILYDGPTTFVDENTVYQRIFDQLKNLSFGRDRGVKQVVNASWSPYLTRMPIFFWLTQPNIAYSVAYSWDNPQAANLDQSQWIGNNTSANASLTVSSGIQIRSIFERIFSNSYNGDPFKDLQAVSAANAANPEKIFLYGLGEFLKIFSKFNQVSASYNYTRSFINTGVIGDAGYLNFFPFSYLRPANLPPSPSLGYQLGFDPSPGPHGSFFTDGNNYVKLTDIAKYGNSLSINTTWQPFSNVSLILKWKTDWSDQLTNQFRSTDGVSMVYEEAVSVERTFLAIGKTIDHFEALFRQATDPNSTETANNKIARSFFQGFMLSSLGASEVLKSSQSIIDYLPLPNWALTISGLNRLPFLEPFLNGMSLSHAYDSKSQYQYIIKDGDYIVNTAIISENYSPLIQIAMDFKLGFRVGLSYSTTRSYSVNFTNNSSISEKLTSTIQVTLGGSVTGLEIPLDIPFLKGIKLSNTLSGNFGFSYTKSSDKTYLFDTPIRTETGVTGQETFGVNIDISYALNKSITVGALWNYTKTIPLTTSTQLYTNENHKFGVTGKITLGS